MSSNGEPVVKDGVYEGAAITPPTVTEDSALDAIDASAPAQDSTTGTK